MKKLIILLFMACGFARGADFVVNGSDLSGIAWREDGVAQFSIDWSEIVVPPAPSEWPDSNSNNWGLMYFLQEAQPQLVVLDYQGINTDAIWGGTESATFNSDLGYFFWSSNPYIRDTNFASKISATFSNVSMMVWCADPTGTDAIMAIDSAAQTGLKPEAGMLTVPTTLYTRIDNTSGYEAAKNLAAGSTTGTNLLGFSYDGLTIINYVNGVEAGRKSYSSILTSTGQRLSLASMNQDGNILDGTLKGARSYERTCASNEFLTVYNQGRDNMTVDVISTNNLTAYYPFTNDLTRFIDSSDNWGHLDPLPSEANTATRVAIGTNGQAEVLYGYYFDGVDDYARTYPVRGLDAANSTMIVGTNSFNLGGWYKIPDIAVRQPLVGIGNIGSDGYRLWLDEVTGKWVFELDVGASAPRAYSDVAAATNVWTHVWGERDGGNISLYINGVQQTNIVAESLDVTTGTSNPFRMGLEMTRYGEFTCYDVGLSVPAVTDPTYLTNLIHNTTINNYNRVRITDR